MLVNIKAEGNITRPSLKSPHILNSKNVILDTFIDAFFVNIGELLTSDIELRFCKDKSDIIGREYALFIRIPDQEFWTIVSYNWFLENQVQLFWELCDHIRDGRRLEITDPEQQE